MKFTTTLVGVLVLSLFADVSLRAQTPPASLNPGQSVSVREGDIWSNATLEKKEGRKILRPLRRRHRRVGDRRPHPRRGGRRRSAGGAGATGATPVTPTPSKAGTSQTPAAESGPISLEGPFTQIDLKPVQGVPRRANVGVHLKPTTRPTAPFTDLTPTAGAGLASVDDLILCADTPSVVVAVGGRQGNDTPLLVIDTNQPSSTETRSLSAKDQTVVAAGDAGRILITKPTAFQAKTLHLWEYRDGQYQLKTNYIFVTNGGNKNPNWARMLTPTHLLLRCDAGETYLIDLPTKKQIGFIRCDDLVVHPSGQFLLTKIDQSNVILRTQDLAIIAEVPAAKRNFTIDSTATYAAQGDTKSVTVTKIATHEQVAQASGLVGEGKFELLGPADLLVDGQRYYDLKTGIPVWNYKFAFGKSMLLANGQMLFVGPMQGQVAACMATIPDAAGALGAEGCIRGQVCDHARCAHRR